MNYNTNLYISGNTNHLKVSSSAVKSFRGFHYYKLLKRETLCWPGDSRFHLLYMLRGSGCLSGPEMDKVIHTNTGILIGNPDDISLEAISGCRILLVSLDEFPDVPEKQFLYSLPAPAIKESLPASVPVIPVLQEYLEMVLTYFKDGFLKAELAEIKYRELLLLLRFYYSPLELSLLFWPMINRSKEFRQIILTYATRVTTAGALQKATGIKRTTFEKKFRKEFGISAHQWLLRQKAFEVRKTLSDPDIPFEEIRKKYGFNSATHFVRFCRNQFGYPPSVLRKRLLKMSL